MLIAGILIEDAWNARGQIVIQAASERGRAWLRDCLGRADDASALLVKTTDDADALMSTIPEALKALIL